MEKNVVDFKKVLDLIREQDGKFLDDSYLPMLATETAKALSDDVTKNMNPQQRRISGSDRH